MKTRKMITLGHVEEGNNAKHNNKRTAADIFKRQGVFHLPLLFTLTPELARIVEELCRAILSSRNPVWRIEIMDSSAWHKLLLLVVTLMMASSSEASWLSRHGRPLSISTHPSAHVSPWGLSYLKMMRGGSTGT
jgi:hypothetical protein